MNENIYKSIKEKTNLKIGFANYERKEMMKKKRIKNLVISVIALGIFLSGMFTVNALTDNSIGNAINETVKNVLNVKVNNKDYNANCKPREDGVMVCTVDSETLGEDAEITIEKYDDSLDDKLEFEFFTE